MLHLGPFINFIIASYFNDQAKTHDSLTDDGYFKTGDLAHVDHNGLYIFDGRASADCELQTVGYAV